MGNFHHRALMVSASVSAYTAPALMIVCLFTNYWIYGSQIKSSPNPIIKPGDNRGLNFTFHRIGLWYECSRETPHEEYNCTMVKYSKTEAKLEKGFKAVAYRSAPSMTCFTAASTLLTIAILLFSRGLCKRRRKAVFFISGLLFSISGLVTMVGVTLYVSITTEESVKSEQNVYVMTPEYGLSFVCAVLSFILQELTGVLTVYWFIYRFRALVRKQEKLRERTRQLMGNCLSMTTALPINLAALNAANSNNINSVKGRTNRLNPNSQYSSTINNQQQRRRLPFDKSPPTYYPPDEKMSCSVFPPRSPTLIYSDYCRILIRTEDMDLLTQMVKSKSQAQLLVNSRPNTPAPIVTNTKNIPNSHTRRQLADNATRRSIRKCAKRTTSV